MYIQGIYKGWSHGNLINYDADSTDSEFIIDESSVKWWFHLFNFELVIRK